MSFANFHSKEPTMTMSTECLYHSDKARFSVLQNDLHKSKWLLRECVHRLAMAVCSCRRNKDPLPDVLERDGLRSELRAILQDSGDQLTKMSQDTINCLYDCTNNDKNLSYYYLTRILVAAKGGNFSHLSREAISSNYVHVPLLPKKPQKLTAAQKLIIERKRKKKLNSVVVPLDMYPGNFRRMEQILGLRMEDCAMKTKGYAKLENDLNTKNMETKKAVTWVRIWGNPEGIKTLHDRFRDAARKAQNKMDEERQARKQAKANRQWIYDNNSANNGSWEEIENAVMQGGLKTRLHDDFALKVHKSAKGSESHKCHTTVSVLDGGHCLQCHKPFTDLKDNSTCTYHEGYLVLYGNGRQKWSCCDVKLECNDDIETLHKLTGCKTSTTHIWRPHAKAKGKDRNSPVQMAQHTGPGPNHNVRPQRKLKSRSQKNVPCVRVMMLLS